MKESGAHAVKMEGGENIVDGVSRVLSAGIPVMGHLGLTPQSINRFGTYVVRAREKEEAEQLIKDALLLEKTGCFAIVLEKVPAELGEKLAGIADHTRSSASARALRWTGRCWSRTTCWASTTNSRRASFVAMRRSSTW